MKMLQIEDRIRGLTVSLVSILPFPLIQLSQSVLKITLAHSYPTSPAGDPDALRGPNTLKVRGP